MALLADRTKPTQTETGALLAFHKDQIAPCRKVALDGFAAAHPAFVAVAAENYATFDADYAALVSGQITWGDFASRSNERAQAYRARLDATSADIERNLADSARFEMQQRQAAAVAFAQWSANQRALAQQQQVVGALNRPRITNRQYIGQQLSCTTF
jgi:hypothetical protein